MLFRPLGKTGLEVSALAFGAGPVSGLMTAGANAERQFETIKRAVEVGINWFDTAATYSGGESEKALGFALGRLGRPSHVHVATKVRFDLERMNDVAGQVRESFVGSLARLQLPRVTLLQLHNAVTARRGQEPTSITPDDVLGPGGVLEAFELLKGEGLVSHLGLTGTGHPAAMKEVVASGRFDVIQVPYHLLNPSAAEPMPAGFAETDYGGIINTCAALSMGVMAIRIFAGGALAEQAPSAHTHTTKFFPLDLYQRDQERAARLAARLPPGVNLADAALRFVLANPLISSAIIGFGEPGHIDQALLSLTAGLLPADWCSLLKSV
jgi:aryl-alcohol dehydrogenase-like predicted oxidoreductase